MYPHDMMVLGFTEILWELQLPVARFDSTDYGSLICTAQRTLLLEDPEQLPGDFNEKAPVSAIQATNFILARTLKTGDGVIATVAEVMHREGIGQVGMFICSDEEAEVLLGVAELGAPQQLRTSVFRTRAPQFLVGGPTVLGRRLLQQWKKHVTEHSRVGEGASVEPVGAMGDFSMCHHILLLRVRVQVVPARGVSAGSRQTQSNWYRRFLLQVG